MQPFSFFAFIPNDMPREADDIAKALFIASIMAAMRDVPPTTRPETHLAAHLATLTGSHIIFLHHAPDVRRIPHETTLSATVRYGEIQFGHLHCVGVPDAAIGAVRAFIAHIAAVCAQMLVVHYCGLVLHNVDEAEMETLPQRLARLTAKEGTTLRYLAHGITPEKSATLQGVALGTIRTYLQKIYAKLEVKGQLQAAVTGVVAQTLGLLP